MSIRGRWVVAALAAAAMVATGCDDGEENGPEIATVRVVYGDVRIEVDLERLEPEDLGDGQGAVYVSLDRVVAAAGLGAPLPRLRFDFVSSSGFRSSQSSSCTPDIVPVPGGRLAQGAIHRETRQLVWEQSLGYPSCLAVADTAEILAFDVEVAARVVEVAYGGARVRVDLGALETVDVDGAGLVRLSEVVAAADLGVALDDLVFDFVSSSGFRPGASSSCRDLVPLRGTLLAEGYIHPATRSLAWDRTLELPSCMDVDDVATIEASDAPPGPFVAVVHDGTSHEVDLSALETVDVAGATLVLLADVVAAAGLEVALDDLVFDFVAADGFRPADSSNCVDAIPLAGSALESGWIDPVTRDLSWDEALALPGCMGVDDVATIEASDAIAPGRIVQVSHGDAVVAVDLSSLETVDVAGVPMVLLADVVEAAALGVALADLVFDFVSSDGFRPGDSPLCARLVPVPGAALSSGWIDPGTGDLSWAAALGFPGCLHVGDVVTIEASAP